VEAQIYHECLRYYPFVLGAEPVRPIDLAAFYASIANEGLRPAPHVVESIERNGSIIYRRDPKSSVTINSVDHAAFYQLKTMLQGVLARGTARAIAGLSPYVAGKTGTTDDENDAWFVGFTNDVTVAVWIGYDNADGKRRTLGGGSTGGHVAVPIFEPVIRAVWAQIAPKTPLAPPSAEAKRQLACKSVELGAEEKSPRAGEKAVRECFRLDAKGKIINTEYRLVSQEERHAKRDQEGSKPRRATSAPRNTSAAVPASNAWSQPWRTQQQWGWQWGASQQWREERREWQTPQSSWGGWR
jgi:membrane carboxypeptidase/penicillin-binding protein